jgi:hypothetical protein
MMCTSFSPTGGGSIAAVGVAGASGEFVADVLEAVDDVALFSVDASAASATVGVVDASASVVDVEVISVRLVVASDEEKGDGDIAST